MQVNLSSQAHACTNCGHLAPCETKLPEQLGAVVMGTNKASFSKKVSKTASIRLAFAKQFAEQPV